MDLTSNVHVGGKWFGPDYPDAGSPPAGKVTNPAAFADLDEDTGEVLRDEDGNPTRDGKPVEVEQSEETNSGAHSSRARSAGAKRD